MLPATLTAPRRLPYISAKPRGRNSLANEGQKPNQVLDLPG
jgi:hypothetical protein